MPWSLASTFQQNANQNKVVIAVGMNEAIITFQNLKTKILIQKSNKCIQWYTSIY